MPLQTGCVIRKAVSRMATRVLDHETIDWGSNSEGQPCAHRSDVKRYCSPDQFTGIMPSNPQERLKPRVPDGMYPKIKQ